MENMKTFLVYERAYFVDVVLYHEYKNKLEAPR
jgi:hypothetical protein